MYSLPGFVYSIHVRSCSSSIHLALNPDKGCAQRQIDAYKKKVNPINKHFFFFFCKIQVPCFCASM